MFEFVFELAGLCLIFGGFSGFGFGFDVERCKAGFG